MQFSRFSLADVASILFGLILTTRGADSSIVTLSSLSSSLSVGKDFYFFKFPFLLLQSLFLVEVSGLEPLTSAVQGQRSTN